jgi:hypothetical protein
LVHHIFETASPPGGLMVTGLFFVFGRRCLTPPLGRHERAGQVHMCSIRRWQPADFDETPDREPKACPMPERKAPLCLPPREPCRFRKLPSTPRSR